MTELTKQELQALSDHDFAALAFADRTRGKLKLNIHFPVHLQDGTMFVRVIEMTPDDVLATLRRRQ